MAIKRFGPVLGAGTQVAEREATHTLAQAPLGVTVMVQKFEKGKANDLTFTAGKNDYDLRVGGLLPDSDGPICGRDFWDMSRGAGELITVCVRPGDEEASKLVLYTQQGTEAAPESGRAVLGTLTAKDGGRWGGRRSMHLDNIVSSGDLTATTLDTGDDMVEDEWAGGTLELKKAAKTYKIVGNTSSGVISVEADQDLLSDYNAGAGMALRYVLRRENTDHLGNAQHLAAVCVPGNRNPTSEFGIKLYEDGNLVRQWPDLSANPTSPSYWVDVINDDRGNIWVNAENEYSGDKTVAEVRPANYHGQSGSLTATVLTLDGPDVVIDSPTNANPTVVVVLGSKVVSQTVVGTVAGGAANITWTTDAGPLSVLETGFHAGGAFDLGDEIGTINTTNGGTALAAGDTITIRILVLVPDEAIGGLVFPDIENEPDLSFQIVDNDRTTVTVRVGNDLTNDGDIAAGAVFQLRYKQQFGGTDTVGNGGQDGTPLTDNDFLPIFDVNTSPINKLRGQNKGLVRMATPGLVSTDVTKAALEYAAARSYEYLVEIPDDITGENEAIDYINNTIGRSDYGRTYLPSFGSVPDPEAPAGQTQVALKQQSLAGMNLGRCALVAREFEGYHKAPAGIDVKLTKVLKLPTGDPKTATVLNEELLNPKGINVIKWYKGAAIMWGDRTISETPEWTFLHARATMSHYVNILLENFDDFIFALNNRTTAKKVETPVRVFFLGEFVKEALFSPKGKFEGPPDDDEAAFSISTAEGEVNNDATRAAGDLNMEIAVHIVDTVERLKIGISKKGINASVA